MSFRTTLSHFKNYLGATLATKALTLISVPVLTRVLGVSPSDYGIISLFGSYVSIFICLVTFNSYVGVSRYYYEYHSDFRSYFGTTVNVNIIILTIVFGVSLLYIPSIAHLLDISPLLCVLLIPALIWGIGNSLFVQILSAQQRSRKLALFSIVVAYLGFIFTVIFTLLNPKEKYLGSIYSQLVVGFLSFLYIIKQLVPYYKYCLSKKHIHYMFNYSLPLIPYFLSSVILGQFDRVMIAKYQTVNDAGLYSFAYNIGMLLTIFFSALNSAWLPKYYEVMHTRNYAEYDKEVSYIHRLTLLAALNLIYFGNEIGEILGSENFYTSLSIVPIVVLGYLFYSYFYFWQWNIDYVKKTLYSSLVVGMAGVLNIILNVLFIPRYGYVAAAYTTTISYLCMAAFAWGINKFVIKLYAVSVRNLYRYFILFVVFSLGYYLLISIENWIVQILLKIILLGMFSSICFVKEFKLILFKK